LGLKAGGKKREKSGTAVYKGGRQRNPPLQLRRENRASAALKGFQEGGEIEGKEGRPSIVEPTLQKRGAHPCNCFPCLQKKGACGAPARSGSKKNPRV